MGSVSEPVGVEEPQEQPRAGRKARAGRWVRGRSARWVAAGAAVVVIGGGAAAAAIHHEEEDRGGRCTVAKVDDKLRMSAEEGGADDKQRLLAEGGVIGKQCVLAEGGEVDKKRLSAEGGVADKKRLSAEGGVADKKHLSAEGGVADKKHLSAEDGSGVKDSRPGQAAPAPAPLPSLDAADAVAKAAAAVPGGKVESLTAVAQQGGGRAWQAVVVGPDGVRHLVTVDGTSGTPTGNTVLGG